MKKMQKMQQESRIHRLWLALLREGLRENLRLVGGLTTTNSIPLLVRTALSCAVRI